MKYRRLGRTGLLTSEIGLGLEHLLDKDQETVTGTIRTAIGGGVNYIDGVAKNYDDYNKLGVALKGLRDKIHLTYIAFSGFSADETDRQFKGFLSMAGTDHVEVFIIACCDKPLLYDELPGENGLLTLARKYQRDKAATFIGLSTHSSTIAHRVIGSDVYDVLMYPINPAFDAVLDEEQYLADNLAKLWDAAYDYQAGEGQPLLKRKNVYDHCVKKNIGLVGMKPFAAGWLFRPDINTGFTPVNLISYALAQKGVSTIIPGCASPDEISEILTYDTCEEAKRDYSAALSKSRWMVSGHCQYCSHCQPCPVNIDIAWVSKWLDEYEYSGSAGSADESRTICAQASSCLQCGICEDRCPFGVDVMNRIMKAADLSARQTGSR